MLNQHEFISKSKSEADLEILAEKFEYSQEPPEEGDSIDIENLSEVETEDYEHPRTRLEGSFYLLLSECLEGMSRLGIKYHFSCSKTLGMYRQYVYLTTIFP